MGAVELLHMEPSIPVVSVLQGQLVVLAVVPPHQHPEAAGGFEFPWLGGPLEHLLPLLADEAGIAHFPPDVQKILLRFRLLDLLQNALQVSKVPTSQRHLLPEVLLRRLGLGVALIILGGVLLGRQQRVQRNGDLRQIFIVVILADQLALPTLHAVEIGGDEAPGQPQSVPLLGGGVILLL